MVNSKMKRVAMTLDARHVPHVRRCLEEFAGCTELSLAPVIAGWGAKGYWSSEGSSAFARVGEKVMIRFTADAELVEPYLRSGFGILAMELIPISESLHVAPVARFNTAARAAA